MTEDEVDDKIKEEENENAWRKQVEEREEAKRAAVKDAKDLHEAYERVYTGVYKLLRSFSADLEHPRNTWAVGQVIASLHLYFNKNQLLSNVRAEDLDDCFREELNFIREVIREHEGQEEKE